jgi:hypothetical protein
LTSSLIELWWDMTACIRLYSTDHISTACRTQQLAGVRRISYIICLLHFVCIELLASLLIKLIRAHCVVVRWRLLVSAALPAAQLLTHDSSEQQDKAISLSLKLASMEAVGEWDVWFGSAVFRTTNSCTACSASCRLQHHVTALLWMDLCHFSRV